MIETSWSSEPSDRPSFDKLTKILGQPVDAILKYSASKQPEKPVVAAIVEDKPIENKPVESSTTTTTTTPPPQSKPQEGT